MRFKNQEIVVLMPKMMVKASSVVVDPVTRVGRLMCFQTREQRPPNSTGPGETLSGCIFKAVLGNE